MEQMRKTPELNAIPVIQAALYYAAIGWPIFPLTGKIPFKDSHGYKDASRDDQLPEAEAKSIILTYANLAPQGKEQYTSKEAIASVRSAYNRPPREPARRI